MDVDLSDEEFLLPEDQLDFQLKLPCVGAGVPKPAPGRAVHSTCACMFAFTCA